MSALTFFDKLAGRLKARAQTTAATWWGIVRTLADGREPSPDAVAEVLQELGKTPDDLRAAVELLKRRRQLKAQVDAVPALRREAADVDAKLARAAEEFDAAKARYAAAADPLFARRAQIEEAVRQAEVSALEQLRATCPYPEAVEAAAAADREACAAHDRANELRAEARKLYALADGHEVRKLDELAAAQRAKADAKRAEAEQFDRQAEALRARADEVWLGLLEP